MRAYEHPGFVLRLVLDQNTIRFEPDFKDFEVTLLNVYDMMLKSLSLIPRVEMKLYSEWVNKCFFLFYYMLHLACAVLFDNYINIKGNISWGIKFSLICWDKRVQCILIIVISVCHVFILIQAWPRNTSYSEAHHLAGDPEGPAGEDHACNTCRKSWTFEACPSLW